MAGVFRAGGFSLPLVRTYVMGILNVTPDSFSDGGRWLDPAAAVARAVEMRDQGADLIDIGGQSTRPGFQVVSPQEEWARLEQVLPAVVRETGLPVSVDTFYPQVARLALEAGAAALNDVSGFGAQMLAVAAASGCGCIIMAPGGAGGKSLPQVRAFFEQRRKAALALGIGEERLCFDPGVGFGTTREEDLALIARPGQARPGACALLVGASRKRVTGAFCGDPPPQQRLPATLAAHTTAILGGADVVRVHDVREAVQAARMADALKRA